MLMFCNPQLFVLTYVLFVRGIDEALSKSFFDEPASLEEQRAILQVRFKPVLSRFFPVSSGVGRTKDNQ